MLLFVTFTNLALNVVDAKLHQPRLVANGDGLSHSARHSSERQPLGLGTAAISSVTEALSPILPFAGGLDLRRKELWDTSNGWFNTVSSMVEQVRVAFGLEYFAFSLTQIPRGGAQLAESTKSKMKAAGKAVKTKRVFSLSAQKPFVSVDTISSMTLSDLTKAFEYAVGKNRPGFNERQFMDSIDARVKPILAKMDSALTTSRGNDILPAATGGYERRSKDKTEKKYLSPVGYGDIDALQFCAAMRLFAEWRIVRQVPNGYKGFAVGMNLGQKDIVQNVAKIEKAVHEWLDRRMTDQSSEDGNPSGPTLRDLLSYEAEVETHPNLPRLKDRTAAMGLLWVRRQLQYQTALFANILEVPNGFATANAAVSAAYSEVYGKYHGWAVQKIFNYSFQAAPEVEEIYKFMNPHHLKIAHQKARSVIAKATKTKEDASVETDSSDSESDLSDKEQLNPLEQLGQHIGRGWDDFANHWKGEWEKLTTNIERVFNKDKQFDADLNDSTLASVDNEQLEEIVVSEMTSDAHDRIRAYLTIVKPVLNDLAGLFDDLNMDDPSKV